MLAQDWADSSQVRGPLHTCNLHRGPLCGLGQILMLLLSRYGPNHYTKSRMSSDLPVEVMPSDLSEVGAPFPCHEDWGWSESREVLRKNKMSQSAPLLLSSLCSKWHPLGIAGTDWHLPGDKSFLSHVLLLSFVIFSEPKKSVIRDWTKAPSRFSRGTGTRWPPPACP